jgi:predicted component of type VI protein secretion system
MGKLVHLRAGGTPAEFRLDRQRITIGRRPDNDVCLAYPAVSGEHAAVVTILADSFLEDLGSTNGTLVNGVKVTKHFLHDRDQIDIGQQVLIYLVDDAATWQAQPASTPATEGAAPRAGLDAPRAKRRSDAVAPARPPSPPAGGGSVTADSAGRAGGAAAAPAAAAVPPAPEPEPVLKVVSGPKAGRIVALVKDETLIGRTGVQVAALRRAADEVRVVPIEGTDPPSVNGIPVAPEGHPLAAGDILEIAGTKLEVVVPGKPASA